jgi:hypothetical protein
MKKYMFMKNLLMLNNVRIKRKHILLLIVCIYPYIIFSKTSKKTAKNKKTVLSIKSNIIYTTKREIT